MLDTSTQKTATMASLLSIVVIPANEAQPIENITLSVPENANVQEILEEYATKILGDSIKLAPVLLADVNQAGLYSYSIVSLDRHELPPKNVRATRLAMACGNLGVRYCGDVLLFRSHGIGRRGYEDLTADELQGACCVSPDLRRSIQSELSKNSDDFQIPLWLTNAAQQNYHDNATISRLASAMMNPQTRRSNNDESGSDESSSEVSDDNDHHMKPEVGGDGGIGTQRGAEFVSRTSLCLHCRGPSDKLCPECKGAYFCKEPRTCRQSG